MKKILLAAALILGVGAASQAQTFAKADNVVTIGIGSGSIASGSSLSIPALSGVYETGMVDGLLNNGKGAIGIGAQLDFVGYKLGNTSGSNVYVGPRASFHYEFVENLDAYAGISAGYYTHGLSGSRSNEFSVSGFAGARYYFTPGLGAFAEFGSGVAYAKVGVAFKF